LAAVLVTAVAIGAPAVRDCHEHRRRGRLVQAEACYAQLVQAPDPFTRAEGYWGLGDYQAANEQFRLAVEREPQNARYRVRWGYLYLDHYQPADAAQLFQEALQLDPRNAEAVLGLARVAAQEFESKAVELAQRALDLDPQLVQAQELLALLALEDGDEERARSEAQKALRISPEALDALSVLATIDWLHDHQQTPWEQKVLAVNPAYGEMYATAGRIFVLNRRYEEGIAFYRKALDRNPKLWQAREQLGVNLMRVGREDEARGHLERCYEAGYRSPAVVNTLRLIDSYRNFETIRTSRAILRLHRKEAVALRPYLEREVERAISVYEKKYGVRLSGPVRVEAYPDHEDFAVRTMGMPGLGALGVTFGLVVAMDSPSARPAGTFNWASTLWHELNHVFVLEITGHRVPRWFIEGLAVYEENRASGDWVEPVGIRSLQAVREKRLLPILELDRGFVRPSYPGQVAVSYFQAGQVCEFIDERWGFDKLRQMLEAFAARKDTRQVLSEVLGVEPGEFDRLFLAWLDQKLGPVIRAFDEWKQKMKLLVEYRQRGDHEKVLELGVEVRNLYPDYVDDDSAYEMLAEAYVALGNRQAAIQELERYRRRGGHNPETIKKLARLYQEEGLAQPAARVLSSLNYWIPVQDQELHRWLGELWLRAGNYEEAIREFEVLIALGPLDPADAHYKLALAYQAAGKRQQAFDAVLRSLEAAPGYRAAQKLLLELAGEKGRPEHSKTP